MNFDEKVRFYQKIFGLENWTIKVKIQQFDQENRHAKTIANPIYYSVTIDIYPLCLNHPEVWDSVLIHEFIHIVMALYDFYVDNLGKEIKNEKGEVITDELFFIARESSVSQLTQIMLRMKGLHETKDETPSKKGSTP